MIIVLLIAGIAFLLAGLLGIVAGIGPFNFPIMVPLWMLPQALMAGNAFILKPSEQVPYGAMKLALLLAEAGLPSGVFNVVNGGRATVEGVVDHPFGWLYFTVARLDVGNERGDHARVSVDGGHLLIRQDSLVVRLISPLLAVKAAEHPMS